jgi:thiosulfate/3-mercaptopyruvate sulfurtransferase
MPILSIEERDYTHPEFLLDTTWLHDHISDQDVRVIDARSTQQYAESHLPGAVNLSGFGGIPRAPSGDMADPSDFEKVAGNLGITNDMKVVVYDAPGQMMGTVAWAFMYYGHKQIQILDGGLSKWISEGKPISQDVPEYAMAEFTASQVQGIYCSLEGAKSSINDPESVFWDTRSIGEYQGKTSVMGATDMRLGRIPGAIHLEWTELFEQETKTLKPARELRELLESRGIKPEFEVNTY